MAKVLSVLMILALCVGIAQATVTAPTVGGKLVMGFDGSDVDTIWDDIGKVWRVTSLNNQIATGAYSSYDAAPPTEARRPILAQMDTGNGVHPVVDFDGENDYLLTSAFATPMQQNNTIFIVARREVAGNTYLMDGISSSGRHYVGTIGTGRYVMGAPNSVISGLYANTDVFEIFSISFHSPVAGNNSRMRVVDANGATQVLLGDVGQHALGGLTLGRATTGGYLNGQIAEVLVYDGSMTTNDLLGIEDYLVNKYLVPEPATMSLLLSGLLLGLRKRRA